eukprot:7314480-Karenia_brevis.AAC.1
MSVWGFPGADQHAEQMASNEALLSKVFAVAAELGPVPVMIAGDFNVDPSGSNVLKLAVSSGMWYDIAVASASASGDRAKPTCFKNAQSEGRRIDAMFCNSTLMPAVQRFKIMQEIAVPTHKALKLDITSEPYK